MFIFGNLNLGMRLKYLFSDLNKKLKPDQCLSIQCLLFSDQRDKNLSNIINLYPKSTKEDVSYIFLKL